MALDFNALRRFGVPVVALGAIAASAIAFNACSKESDALVFAEDPPGE